MAVHVIRVESLSTLGDEPVVADYSPHFEKTLVGYSSGRVEAKGTDSLFQDVEFARSGSTPTFIASNPLYDVVAIGWDDGVVSLWSGEQELCFESQNYNDEDMFAADNVSAMVWASNGTMLITGTTGGIVIAWDLQISRSGYTLQPVGSFKRRGAVTHIVLRTQPSGAWGRSTQGNPVGIIPFTQTIDNPADMRGAMEFFVAYSTGSLVRASDADDFQPSVVKSLGAPLCGLFYIPLSDSFVAITEIGMMHIFKFENRVKSSKLIEETKAQLELDFASGDGDRDEDGSINDGEFRGRGDVSGSIFGMDGNPEDDRGRGDASTRGSGQREASATKRFLQHTRIQCVQLWCDSLAIINTGLRTGKSSQIKIWNVDTLSTDILKIPSRSNVISDGGPGRGTVGGEQGAGLGDQESNNEILSISFNYGTGILCAISKNTGYFWRPTLKNNDTMEWKQRNNFVGGDSLQWNLFSIIELNSGISGAANSPTNTVPATTQGKTAIPSSVKKQGTGGIMEGNTGQGLFSYSSVLMPSSLNIGEMHKGCKFYWFLSHSNIDPFTKGGNSPPGMMNNSGDVMKETSLFSISLDQPSISFSMSVQPANVKGLLGQQQGGRPGGIDSSDLTNNNINPFAPYNLNPSKCIYQTSHNTVCVLTNITTTPYTLTKGGDELDRLYGEKGSGNISAPNMYLYSTSDCNIYQTSSICQGNEDDFISLPNKFVDYANSNPGGQSSSSLNTTIKITTPFSIKGTDINGRYIILHSTGSLNVYEIVKNDLNDNGVGIHNIKPVISLRWGYIRFAILVDESIVLVDDKCITRLAMNGQVMEKLKYNVAAEDEMFSKFASEQSASPTKGKQSERGDSTSGHGSQRRGKGSRRGTVDEEEMDFGASGYKDPTKMFNTNQRKNAKVTSVSKCVLQLPTMTQSQTQQFAIVEQKIGAVSGGNSGSGGGSSLSTSATTIPVPAIVICFDNGMIKYIFVTKKQMKVKNIFIGDAISKLMRARATYNSGRGSTPSVRRIGESGTDVGELGDHLMFDPFMELNDTEDLEDLDSVYSSYANNSVVLSNGDLMVSLAVLTNFQKTPMPTCVLLHFPFDNIDLGMKEDVLGARDQDPSKDGMMGEGGLAPRTSSLSLVVNDGYNLLCVGGIPVSLSVSRGHHLQVGNFVANQLTNLMLLSDGKQLNLMSRFPPPSTSSSDVADLVMVTFMNPRRPLEPIYTYRTIYVFNDYYRDYVFNNENVKREGGTKLRGDGRKYNGKTESNKSFQVESNSNNILIPFSNLPLPNSVALDTSIVCQCILVVNYGIGVDGSSSDSSAPRGSTPVVIGLNKLISNTNYYNLDLINSAISKGGLLDAGSINNSNRNASLVIPQYIPTTTPEQILLIHKYILTGRIDHAYSSIMNGNGSNTMLSLTGGGQQTTGNSITGSSVGGFQPSSGSGVAFDGIAPNSTVECYLANSTYLQLIRALLSSRNFGSAGGNNEGLISSTNVNLLLTCIYSMKNCIYNIVLRSNNAIGKGNNFDSSTSLGARNNLLNVADLLFGSVDNILERCNYASSSTSAIGKGEFSLESNANSILTSTQNILSSAGLYMYAQRVQSSKSDGDSFDEHRRILMSRVLEDERALRQQQQRQQGDARAKSPTGVVDVVKMYKTNPEMAVDFISQNLATKITSRGTISEIDSTRDNTMERQNIAASFTLAKLLLKDKKHIPAAEILFNIGYLTMALRAAITGGNDDLVLRIAKECVAKWQQHDNGDGEDGRMGGEGGSLSSNSQGGGGGTNNSDQGQQRRSTSGGNNNNRDNYKRNVVLAANYFSNNYVRGEADTLEEGGTEMSSANQLLIALMLFRQIGEVELALSACYQTGYIDGIIYVIEGEQSNTSSGGNTSQTNLDFMRHITPSLLSKIGIKLAEEGERIEDTINNEMAGDNVTNSVYPPSSYYTSALICFTNGCLYKEAIALLHSHGSSITITSPLLSTLVVPKEQTGNMPTELRKLNKNEFAKFRIQTINKIAEILSGLHQHAAAAKMYVQAGDKVGAIQALIRGGNTKGVLTFASASGDPKVYIAAGNYLQGVWTNSKASGNTKEADVILQKLTQFYVKAQGYDNLVRFHFNNAIAMITDQRDYAGAKHELDECSKVYQKFGKQISSQTSSRDLPELTVVQRQIALVDLYNTLDNVADTVPDEMASSCMLLIKTLKEEESIVRVCDVYGKLITFYYIRGDKGSCADVLQAIAQDGMQPADCIDQQVVDEILGADQYDMEVENVEMSS